MVLFARPPTILVSLIFHISNNLIFSTLGISSSECALLIFETNATTGSHLKFLLSSDKSWESLDDE